MLQRNQKVFGIGLSRTGTTSLSHALNVLGIPTIHFPSDPTTLEELRSGNYDLSILKSFQGAVDISVAPYYAQLDQVFPGSKFILTIRPIEDWLEGVQRHWNFAERWADYPFIEFIRSVVYGTVAFNRDRFQFVYATHVRNVCDYFSNRQNDFLILDICSGEGWDKLCPFLSLPVPDISFPRLNDSTENVKWTKALDSAVNRLRAATPPGNYVIIGNGKLGIELPGMAPVENRNGLDWGAAANDEALIHEVSELRNRGIQFLVFLFPFFWWFEHYREFNRYLQTHSRCLMEDNELKILEFD